MVGMKARVRSWVSISYLCGSRDPVEQNMYQIEDAEANRRFDLLSVKQNKKLLLKIKLFITFLTVATSIYCFKRIELKTDLKMEISRKYRDKYCQ